MFSERWIGRGDEKSDTQTFWLELLHDVLEVDSPGEIIEFEKRVELSHVSFIDAYIPQTGIIIEQKSIDVNLDSPAKQSDGTLTTPFEQAKRYYDWLPASQRGRYIVVCNFTEIRIHDMETPRAQPEVILLRNLGREAHKLAFLIDRRAASPKEIREVELSVKAGELVGKLYDSLLERYVDPDDKDTQRSLNVFCVRTVFLLYAEDAGLFAKSQFHDYLKTRKLMARNALRELFTVLNQKPEERDSYIDDALKAFPFVNGGLFSGDDIEIPKLDGEPLRIILEDMSEGFDWKDISPTIFGALFEATLNPETRHTGGMHYTSIENIHKVIDPLFMDGLNREFSAIMANPPDKARTQKLRAFQKKLASLRFFDPACGSGNFLTESYLSLRRLENSIITELTRGQITFAFTKTETPVLVQMTQFYGFEINDFAVHVARTALWIAEAQMWNETKNIVKLYEDFLPLKSQSHHIEERNALRENWQDFIPHDGQLYIIGNPPFLGYSVQNSEQKKDMASLYTDSKGKPYSFAGKIDYVAGWYYKASELIHGTKIRAAFLSTNSITQGEQITYVFKTLQDKFRIHVDFAHPTFVWDSEAPEKAQVHCVVIGFNGDPDDYGVPRRLITGGGVILAENINFYLVPGPDVYPIPRVRALCRGVPAMMGGSMPLDGGFLLLTPEERAEIIRREPKAEKWIKRYMMGDEFINNIERYCLWLVGIKPNELRSMPAVMDRVRGCQNYRRTKMRYSKILADRPTEFREHRNPEHYLAIPKTSSEKRPYIPMGFLDGSVIPGGGGLMIIPDATLYDFGVLTSRVHMGWVRRVTGRLKSDYRYSARIDYNCFVWPECGDGVREEITRTAQGILDVRACYPESSYADLYDDVSMPWDLRRAHRENDAAVCRAYGFAEDMSEFDVVGELFKRYEEMTR